MLIKPHTIIEVCCKQANLTPKEVMWSGRKQAAAECRFVIYYFLCQNGLIYCRIAELFNKNDTSIYHGVRRVIEDSELKYKTPINTLTNKVQTILNTA